MKDMNIGLLRPENIPQLIAEFADISILILATIPLVIMENIILVMLVEVDIGHNIPYTLPLAIGEQSLMLKGKVDIGLRPDTLTPIT